MSAVLETRASAPDFAAIKQRQQATWASGDFAVVGTTLQIVGESLAEAADVRAGNRVLDVAAGNGNATLAAARRFADVTSTDYVPALLDKGRERARAEGLGVQFQVADAEDLPFDDGSFDIVLSTFGAMFTPDHERVAGEMLRVLRPGGRIGMAVDAVLETVFRGADALVHGLVALVQDVLHVVAPHVVGRLHALLTAVDFHHRTEAAGFGC